MESPNLEKSKVSRIPVRAKPPSRLPVPITALERGSKKTHTRPNPSLIENDLSKAQVKTKKATILPTSRKVLPYSHQNRFVVKDSIRTLTNRRLKNTADPTVNKKPSSYELPTKIKATKLSNQPANKKSLNKEIVAKNKKLEYATSQNQIEKSTRGNNSNINRRFTSISNKGSTFNKKSTAVQRNIKITNLTDETETIRHTKFGFQTNQKKDLEVKQGKDKLLFKGSTLSSKATDKFNIKARKAELKFKKDVSFDIQDPPHSVDNKKEKLSSKATTLTSKPSDSLNFKASKSDVKCQKDVLPDQSSNYPLDIPLHTVDKKNEDKNHFLQSEIDFVADERYRNQILFGQGISPIKPQPVKNSLIRDRSSSFFFKSKTSLRALERLEEEGRRVSMMRMSGKKMSAAGRTSLFCNYSPAARLDPIQGVLRALENVDLAAEDRRVSAMKRNNIHFNSPSRAGSPFNKPQINPYKTALKKIEALEMKRKAKSTKKVTFNLEPSDLGPTVLKQGKKLDFDKVKANVFMDKRTKDITCSIAESQPKKSTTPELQFSTNPLTENKERNFSQPHYQSMLQRVCGQDIAQNNTEVLNEQSQSTICSDGQTSVSHLISLSSVKNTISPPKSMLLPQNAGQIGSNISDSVGPCFRTTSSNLLSEHSRYLLQPQTESEDRRNTISTINNKSYPKSIVPQNATKTGSSIYDFIGPCLKNGSKITSSVLTSEDPRLSFYLSRQQIVQTEPDNTRRSTISSYSLSSIKNKISPSKSFPPQNAPNIVSNVSNSVGPGFRNCNKITSSILPSEDPRFSLYLSRPQTIPESETRRSTLSSYSLSTMKYKHFDPKSSLLQQNATDSNRLTSSCFASEDPRCSLYLSRPQTIFESNTLSRLCTPKPISFFSKPCTSISPEFLCQGKSQIVAHAPICTPMAMRTLAANFEETLSPLTLEDVQYSPICHRLDFDEIQKESDYETQNKIQTCPRVATLINLEETFSDEECSPVCLRLDFDAIEKESACEAFRVCSSPSKVWKFPIQSIRTNQQILDGLADEECNTILSLAAFPVITERSFGNPVAQILAHGDDMHFVPLKLK